MKKSLLALAVAALAASSVASAATIYDKDGVSVDVYGRVQAVYYSQDSGSNAQSAANDGNLNASSRLGFNFRSELTSWAAAFANVEWQNADDDANNDFNSRYLWVGVDFGQFGAVKFGKFEDAVKYVIATTDIFDDWGCNGQLGNDDRFWAEGSVGGNAAGSAEKADIEYSYAASVGYTSPAVLFGPISVKAGFGGAQFQDQDAADNNGGDYYNNFYDSYTQWAVAASWGTLGDGLYLGVMGQARSFDVYKTAYNSVTARPFDTGISADDYTVSGVEAVVSYGFANGVSLTTGWEWMNVDYDGADNPDVDAYTIPVYVNYQINPNFRVWAEARFDAGTDDGNTANDSFKLATNECYNLEENVYSIGARYTF